ncbi:MAG: SpoIIIAH-like family protein [Oscillospiraceae bacterium]|nr:SpoIIIAH-like family protein [Oscillospiraceae bacterium]
MQKPSLIIGKKQLVLSGLTVLLATAVYINYTYTRTDLQSAQTTPVTELEQIQEFQSAEEMQSAKEIQSIQDENISVPHYGDTEFVNAGAEPDPAADYFAKARLEKTTSRDEAVQTLQMIMGGGDITEQEAVTAALDAAEVASMIEHEGTIESLIKSQGFSDCVVYLDADTAKVVVRTDGLDESGAALIKSAILEEVSIPAENIRIFEVK